MATKKKKTTTPRRKSSAAQEAQVSAKTVAVTAKSPRGKGVLIAIGMFVVLIALAIQVEIMARHQASLTFNAIHVGQVIPQGLDKGQARSPLALQGDKADNLFFLEGEGGLPVRLQKFDPTGHFLEIYTPKSVDQLIENDVDMDVDPQGEPWVLLKNGQIKVLSPDLKYLRTVAVAVNGPSALGLSQDGRIYVASNSDNKVLYFDSTGKKLGEFGAPGTHSGDITQPVRMRVTVDGLIVVLEQTSTGPHAKVFGPDLKLRTQFDLNNVPGSPSLHMGVTLDDMMIINDQATNRGLLVWNLKTGNFYGESKGCTDQDLFISPGSSGANKYSNAIYMHSINGLTHCLLPEGKGK